MCSCEIYHESSWGREPWRTCWNSPFQGNYLAKKTRKAIRLLRETYTPWHPPSPIIVNDKQNTFLKVAIRITKISNTETQICFSGSFTCSRRPLQLQGGGPGVTEPSQQQSWDSASWFASHVAVPTTLSHWTDSAPPNSLLHSCQKTNEANTVANNGENKCHHVGMTSPSVILRKLSYLGLSRTTKNTRFNRKWKLMGLKLQKLFEGLQ